MGFRNRAEAARLLAHELVHLRDGCTVVLGLPRHGVALRSVAAPVADWFRAAVDRGLA